MINTYLFLFAAIAFEVAGTMMLPLSQNFTKGYPTAILIASYGLSFYFLAIVSTKLPLSVVYASWAGLHFLIFRQAYHLIVRVLTNQLIQR